MDLLELLGKAKWEEDWLGISNTQMDGEPKPLHHDSFKKKHQVEEVCFVSFCATCIL